MIPKLDPLDLIIGDAIERLLRFDFRFKGEENCERAERHVRSFFKAAEELGRHRERLGLLQELAKCTSLEEVQARIIKADQEGEVLSDTHLLDFVESQKTGYGAGVVLRISSTGRGFRLHETSSEELTDLSIPVVPRSTVREAIIDAITRNKKDLEKATLFG